MSKLTPIENQNQRVLLTSQLAEQYETTPEVISNNFNRNKEHYQEGKHYFCLEGEDLKEFKTNHQFDEQFKHTPRIYLWTEKGALLHAKSLGTDKAWEVYEELVDTYFKAHEIAEQQPMNTLDFLEYTVKALREQQEGIIATNKRIDNIGDIIALDTRSWREDAHKLIIRIAQKQGGNDYIHDTNAEIYNLVDQRGGGSLKTRLTNKQQRMAMEGVCKSKRDKLNKVDIIADDKKLIEIYVAIVKERAIKNGIEKKSA